MYIISPQFITDYIVSKFSTIGRLSYDEFIMESLFEENDYKRHMSVNVDSGLWQCFKTGRKGNFISLYAHAENLPYLKAQQKIILANFEFLGKPVPNIIRPLRDDTSLDTHHLIPVNINSCDDIRLRGTRVWEFLFGRKLFTRTHLVEEEYYYYTGNGKFNRRLIIPFRDEGHMFFFQSRTLERSGYPKYLSPSIPKSSDTLYPYDEEANFLVVCEGPLDAKSLQLQGINATSTMGSSISHNQMELLSTFPGKIILGYDNDEAGRKGILRFDNIRKSCRLPEFSVCFPPPAFKDWNDAHQAMDSLPRYVRESTQLFDWDFVMRDEIKKL